MAEPAKVAKAIAAEPPRSPLSTAISVESPEVIAEAEWAEAGLRLAKSNQNEKVHSVPQHASLSVPGAADDLWGWRSLLNRKSGSYNGAVLYEGTGLVPS